VTFVAVTVQCIVPANCCCVFPTLFQCITINQSLRTRLHNSPELLNCDTVHQRLHGQPQLGVVLNRVEAGLVVHRRVGRIISLHEIAAHKELVNPRLSRRYK
jgi:hypothetical protein